MHELGTRARNCIFDELYWAIEPYERRAKGWEPSIEDARTLSGMTDAEISRIPNCGQKALREIRAWHMSLGFEPARYVRPSHPAGLMPARYEASDFGIGH